MFFLKISCTINSSELVVMLLNKKLIRLWKHEHFKAKIKRAKELQKDENLTPDFISYFQDFFTYDFFFNSAVIKLSAFNVF